MTIADVPVLRTFHHEQYSLAELTRAKRGRSISVCLPARDEASTIGPIVSTIRTELLEAHGLVDEILVLDDHSSDGTAEVAETAGARVVQATDVLHDVGSPNDGHGKGQAMWKSLSESSGDLVLWCDADVTNFAPRFVSGLLGPLLTEPDVVFAKGFYDRPLSAEGAGGGRVTELMARPLIALLFPELSPLVQPLAGEYGGRREVLERVPFVEGYGVDLALLIDIARGWGVESMCQVDLGVRLHRNRPLNELGPQALAVLHTGLQRADPDLVGQAVEMLRPGFEAVEEVLRERPPLAGVPSYRRRRTA